MDCSNTMRCSIPFYSSAIRLELATTQLLRRVLVGTLSVAFVAGSAALLVPAERESKPATATLWSIRPSSLCIECVLYDFPSIAHLPGRVMEQGSSSVVQLTKDCLHRHQTLLAPLRSLSNH